MQAGIEDGAGVNRHDGVAAGRGETDMQCAIAAAPGMRGEPSSTRAVGIDEFIDAASDIGLGERIDHDLAFPRAIAVRLPVLDRAAAAGAEILAERRDPFGAGAVDAQELPAVGMIGDFFRFDRLAAERIGHEQRLPFGKSDTVAALADVIDAQAFSHGERR